MSTNNDIITATNTAKLGKIVKIRLSYTAESKIIDSIKITGDFFLHPEEAIELLEQGLIGINLEKEELKNKIESLLKDSEFYGFDESSLANAILDAR